MMRISTSAWPAPHRVAVSLVTSALLSTCLASCSGGSQAYSAPTTPAPPPPPPVVGAISYVDCSAASNGTGTQSSPWNTLLSVDATTFNAGDQILFNRGTTCSGILAPLGSGTTTSPIVIDAYGTGPQPIIDGGMNVAAVQLMNQQGWEINNLEIVGGNYYGVYISVPPRTPPYLTSGSPISTFMARITSAPPRMTPTKFSLPPGMPGEFNDVVIDGVMVHDSTVNNGIFIDAGTPFNTSPPVLGNGITIQNSTVYNVYEEGMTIFSASNGLMQNNVVHNSGQCPPNPGCGRRNRRTDGLVLPYLHDPEQRVLRHSRL